jgi:hypothetical protein
MKVPKITLPEGYGKVLTPITKMPKITLEKGSWGDYTAYIDGVEVPREPGSIKLDRADLLEQVLAKLGIEVETKWHYYVTREVDGKQRGVRVDDSSTNMKGA